MCGIAGIYAGRPFTPAEHGDVDARLRAMAGALNARGPDGMGVDLETEVGLGLAHTRLAIVDLSADGRQPMESACGRYVITFNGEIYNHRELRHILESRDGVRLRSHCDTEVLLEVIAHWGCESALTRCSGMFAFALWDRQRRELTLARDWFGKKPLYYKTGPDGFLFASEIRALRAGDRQGGAVSPAGVANYLALGYMPHDCLAYDDIQAVPPGTLLRVQRDPNTKALSVDSETFFDVFRLADNELYIGGSMVPEDLDRDLEGAARRAVVLRSQADVPMGVFLSGGVDSSLIAAIARNRDLPLKAFTMGFEDPAFDESAEAAAIARHLGLEHHVRKVSEDDIIGSAEAVIDRFDEPLADQSLLPTMVLCRLVREEVKVCLSGDGGDELFGGYGKYDMFARLHRSFARMPDWLRRALAALAQRDSPAEMALYPKSFAGQRLFKALNGAADFAALSRMALTRSPMINRYLHPDMRRAHLETQAAHPPPGILAQCESLSAHVDVMALLQILDQATYLTDNILRKTDMASMANSLEVRNPFMDRDVIRVSWRLKTYALNRPKGPLRDMLERRVPRALWDRPKKGFSPPMQRWLAGPLRDWAGDQLDLAIRRFPEYLDVPAVRSAWNRASRNGMSKMQAQEFWSLIMLNTLRTEPALPAAETAGADRASCELTAAASAAKITLTG